MSSLFGPYHRISTALSPPAVTKSSQPIKFGILGAAKIAPPALILPARNHPEVVVYAVAARDRTKAENFARKYTIEKVYSGTEGYQQLLNDSGVDAIYNALPNGLHYEWTMKALSAGKHVLLEKPAANTADETRKMFELAEQKGLVLLEAFHYRFHPAAQRVKEILGSGELGPIKSVNAVMAVPKGIISGDDIRFNYELGGGAMMDMGCYTLNIIRYLTSSEPTSVVAATATPYSESHPESLVDTRMIATLALPSDITATLTCDLSMAPRFRLIPRMPQFRALVRCQEGEVELFNFILPTAYHWIEVRKMTNGGKTNKRVEKAYTFKDGKGQGEEWWTTYRHQLSAFVDRVQGRTPQTWLSKEDSVNNAHWIEEIYKKSGLGSRKASTFVLQLP